MNSLSPIPDGLVDAGSLAFSLTISNRNSVPSDLHSRNCKPYIMSSESGLPYLTELAMRCFAN